MQVPLHGVGLRKSYPCQTHDLKWGHTISMVDLGLGSIFSDGSLVLLENVGFGACHLQFGLRVVQPCRGRFFSEEHEF